MSKTINFYNVVITLNGEKTNIDFLKFLDDIERVSWENRVRNIRDEVTAMFPMHYNSRYPEMRIIPIGKFRRGYKPYIGHITTPTLDSVKNDIVELVTMVYDKRYRTAVIEYNHYGLKSGAIEDYFASFLPDIEGEKLEVNLVPITTRKTKEDIEKSRQIRYIEIKLKLDEYTQGLIKKGINMDETTILDLFSGLKGQTEELGADTIKIEFNAGMGNNATMDLESANILLNTLNIDHSCIDSLKVRYRESKTEKLDTINLKDLDVNFKDKILENDSIENPAPEYIGNTIIETYNNYEGTLLQSYEEIIEDMIAFELPRIQSIPKEEHRIDLDG